VSDEEAQQSAAACRCCGHRWPNQRLLKKLANHEAALALHFMHYNFVRIHQTLRVTPAMAAGVTDRLWSIEDIAALVEAAVPKPGPRGLYKKLATT
jgi:hypothetical protein